MSTAVKLPWLGLALLLAACVPPGQETGGGGAGGGNDASAGGGAPDGASACEEKAFDCEGCASCAAQGACIELVNACGADPECTTLDQCLGICGGEPECADGCYLQYPGAIELHGRAMGCVYCDQCPNACAAASRCS